ncbi:hypothetical protein ACIREM_34170 [Streptomyces shenzhenensis]|uniref:hypothetical protein n=1 Tax=Streptomyces shenzhenensis TaxID=943815 RepID=UPI00380AB1C4
MADLGDEFVPLDLADQVGGFADLVDGDAQPAMFDRGDGEPGVQEGLVRVRDQLSKGIMTRVVPIHLDVPVEQGSGVPSRLAVLEVEGSHGSET